MKDSYLIMDLFWRYAALLIVALLNLGIFYLVLTPLTIYPVYLLLNIFFDLYLAGNLIVVIGHFPIEIVNSCIAGSAYSLLLILNLATLNIKFKDRIKIFITSFLALLIINILRIFFLSILFVNDSVWFDFLHKLFWGLLSTLFVTGIWFIELKKFKIKNIPFFSDLKFLYENSVFKK